MATTSLGYQPLSRGTAKYQSFAWIHMKVPTHTVNQGFAGAKFPCKIQIFVQLMVNV